MTDKNIKRSIFNLDNRAIDDNCKCYTCLNFSSAYLSHLYRSKELTYFRLASIHNLYYYLNLMKDCREAILNNIWLDFRKNFYAKLNQQLLFR